MKNTILFLSLFLAVAILFSFCQSNNGNDEELKQHIKDGAFLLDVRTPEEFAAGTASGAVNIPIDELKSRLSELQGKQHIVVFCKSGGRSTKAENLLKEDGILNVTNGMTWQKVVAAQK